MIDDLERFEILQACYPEKFPDENDDSWDNAQEFSEVVDAWDLIERLIHVAGTKFESSMTGGEYVAFLNKNSTPHYSMIKRGLKK